MRWAIAVGGVSVILAVVLIFFYLLWVVFPLFLPADSRLTGEPVTPQWGDTRPVYLSIEEQREVGLRIDGSGELAFFEAATGRMLEQSRLPIADDAELALATESVELDGLVAAATSSGDVLLLRHQYEIRFDGGVETRRIVPELEYPYGPAPLLESTGTAPAFLALSDNDRGLILASATRDGLLRLNRSAKRENFLTGTVELEPEIRELRLGYTVSGLAVSGNHRWLYVGDDTAGRHAADTHGFLAFLDLDLRDPRFFE